MGKLYLVYGMIERCKCHCQGSYDLDHIFMIHHLSMFRKYIKTTVVYRCSKVINRLRENQSRLQTKTEGNKSTTRGKQ